MHSKNDNIEIMSHDQADKVIEELFELPLCRYQIRLETSMKSSDFIFDCAHLLDYKFHKKILNCIGSYIDSPDLIKSKKSTINPVNDADKCFQYSATVALNHE